MRVVLILIFAAVFSSAIGQDTLVLASRQDSIYYLTSLIQKDGSLESIGTGPIGFPSKQYYRFVFLLTLVNTFDLLDLTKKSTGALRIYAYMGLYQRNYKRLREVVEYLKTDTTEVSTLSGCELGVYTVKDAIKSINNWYWKNQTIRLLDTFNKDEKFRADYFKWMTSQD